jgi:selenium metabolism protein YedF
VTQQIDLRGLICPEPVLKAKKILDDVQIQAIEVLVDDDVCVNNLQRLARSLKATAVVKQQDNCFHITIEKDAPATTENSLPAPSTPKVASVIFLSKDYFGQGDLEFSRNLLNLFLQTTLDAGHEPQAILMANSAVKLMAPDSPFAKVLDDFKQRGCEVLACGLCLEFYGLKDQVAKEQITNMFAITEYLFAADKVISP